MNYQSYLLNRENQEVVIAYVKQRFPEAKLINQKYFLTKCPFNRHDHDTKRPAFNIDLETGKCFCHKCGKGGNLITLAKHFGDNLKNLFN